MASMLKGNAVVGQAGGPTVVINESLVGVIQEIQKYGHIEHLLGARHGVRGIINRQFLDLKRQPSQMLDLVGRTPAAALGATRDKPDQEYCEKILDVFRSEDVRYFFYIGGNDSAETTHIINEEARKAKYDFRCFHICKTIDNDLRENDHTPGFGSGAKFVASAFMGDNLDNRALPGVKINIIMGRHAGFLTAAAALARIYPDDGPHLIYLPERAFSMDKFLADVKAVYKKLGRCLIAVSEGISDAKGTPVASLFIKEVDSHGNVQLSGSGALGDLLAGEVRAKLGISRVRADTLGYLQRSFAGVVSETDAKEAREVGRLAVKFSATQFESGSVAIVRKPGKKYAVTFKRVPLKNVAKETRHMPDHFITKSANDVTKAFVDYARPLAGKLPAIGRLKNVPVKKK